MPLLRILAVAASLASIAVFGAGSPALALPRKTSNNLAAAAAGSNNLAAADAAAAANPMALQATPVLSATTTGFGTFIEGAATDLMGNLFAVNFGTNTALATLGLVCPSAGTAELFLSQTPMADSAYNGLRFTANGQVAYIADKGAKRLLKINPFLTAISNAAGGAVPAPTPQVVCANANFLAGVPNDLAITTAGNHIYLSGQNYTPNTTTVDGEIWLCDPATSATTRLAQMGRTNGIELSPDNKVLYVSEAFNVNNNVVSNVIWKYDRDPATGMIANKQLFANFSVVPNDSPAVDIDGMRTDTAGNLYVARNGGGSVAKFDPAGNLVARITTPGTMFPTNLEFGGIAGTTLFVVGRCGNSPFGQGVGCVDKFENDTPGRAITELRTFAQ
ncbi:hypothetical protein DFJ73DRAFT_860356 [Zopfochytrium polystomum]|nr:hypothetical protein DFJ73DRAFT_860356 [Zopfochytrium polystomum]